MLASVENQEPGREADQCGTGRHGRQTEVVPIEKEQTLAEESHGALGVRLEENSRQVAYAVQFEPQPEPGEIVVQEPGE